MIQALKERVTILPGGRVELEKPDLPTGAEAEVIVLIEVPSGYPSAPLGTAASSHGPISPGQPPDYGELLQVPNADEADRWGWDWEGPDQNLKPRVLPLKPGPSSLSSQMS